MPPLADAVQEAGRIMSAAGDNKIVLRLFGGVSFSLRCPSAQHRGLQRQYVDIDFIGHANQATEIKDLFVTLGYVGRDRFNAIQGDTRLIFNDMKNQRRVDIFLDVFEMCHRFNFKDRLELDDRTLSLADMLATKLQIVEISEKDLKDILSVFVDFDVGNTDSGVINGAYLAKLCGDDWGVYKTFSMNLDRVRATLDERPIDQAQKELVKARVERLRGLIEGTQKSLKWRMRARLGEKKRWYELPEVDKEVVDSRIPTSNIDSPA